MLVDSLIAEGLSLVRDDPSHDLRLGFRRRFWSSFDESGPRSFPEAGHHRRVRLSAVSILKVLPLWDSLLPSDRAPQEALELAENLLKGSIDCEFSNKAYHRLWTHSESVTEEFQQDQKGTSVVIIAFGALRVIAGAQSDGIYQCESTNDRLTDADIDPPNSEASFFAAAAYSGGAVWEPESDKQKRREFWTWWLTSAVKVAIEAE
jgi:Immunity protein Imm5